MNHCTCIAAEDDPFATPPGYVPTDQGVEHELGDGVKVSVRLVLCGDGRYRVTYLSCKSKYHIRWGMIEHVFASDRIYMS